MGIARICGDFWTHQKRIRLERLILDRGHAWRYLPGMPMSAGECCARVLAWLNGLGDPHGAIPSARQLEDAASWPGAEGALYRALLDVGLVDVGRDAQPRWHDFYRLNGETLKKRRYRLGCASRVDTPRDEKPPDTVDETGSSGSGLGSGLGSGSKEPSADSEVGGAKDLIDRFAGVWNKAVLGRHIRALRRPPPAGSVRGKRLLAFVSDARKASDDRRIVPACIEAAMSQTLHDGRRERGEDPLDLDWFLRPEHREKHIGLGLDKLAALNGSPA